MKCHLINLTPSVPITFIYGEESPYHNVGGASIKEVRENVFVPAAIAGAGHHVHAQASEEFNKLVISILSECK